MVDVGFDSALASTEPSSVTLTVPQYILLYISSVLQTSLGPLGRVNCTAVCVIDYLAIASRGICSVRLEGSPKLKGFCTHSTATSRRT